MKNIPRIAIVGAGPGGLTLARILHLAGISATVFERDEHALSRPQGGTLDLHADSGLLAIEQAGLTAEFLKHARYEDQGGKLLDSSGRVLFEESGDAANYDRPEIDRTALRDILLGALPPGQVRWNHDLRMVRPLADGTFELMFSDVTAGPFDLVVGADGTWSRVRPLVSSYQPQYSGLTFIEFGIDDIDRRHPALAELVGHGKMSAEGGGKCLMAIRNGNSHVRVYAMFRVPTDWAEKTFDFAWPPAARERLLVEFRGWAPELLNLIRVANDMIVPRHIHALPVGHHWINRPGITLIGDAAHVMSPFGGDGVNMAMLDATRLANLLAETPDWTDAVRAYEQEMFERMVEPATGAAEAAATELSHIATELTLEHIRAHQAMAAAE